MPASHLKFGEDPREAARRVGEGALGIPGLRYSEPRSEVDFYPSKMVPGEMHYDIWFFVDGAPPKDYEIRVPPWYTELSWRDPRAVPATDYARGHEDVVARWMAAKSNRGRSERTAAAGSGSPWTVARASEAWRCRGCCANWGRR